MNSHIAVLTAQVAASPSRKSRTSASLQGNPLGDEPAIVIGGGASPAADRHGFSYRWLLASLLVGVCGCALLGGAVYISAQGDTTFAESPEMVSPAAPPTGAAAATARKGDKLVQQVALPSARQVIRAPFSQRVGDREVIKNRPFIRLASNLSLTAGTLSADIPPFNPLRLFSEGAPGTERVAEQPVDVPDADVALVKRDLGTVAFSGVQAALSDNEVIAQIEEERANQAAAGRRAVLPIPPQLMLSRTLRTPGEAPIGPLAYAPATDTIFSNIDVRVVPENVTELAKTRAAATREAPVEERVLLIRRGENFDTVLRTAGAGPDQIRTMVAALGGRSRVQALPEGQVLQVTTVAGARPGDQRQIVRISLVSEGRIETMVAVNDRGIFVPVQMVREDDEPKPRRATRTAKPNADDDDNDNEGTGARLYDSLYETALRLEMPRVLIDEMVRIFAHDLDFQRRISGGDNLEVIFTDEDEGEGSRTELLFASLSVGGETRRVFRFHAPDDGVIDFFDEDGRSLKKFLLRKPVAGDVEMRSGFGMRFHPVLRYGKMHTGVDWANGRVGTPIISAGHGTVIKAGWDTGYGRRVEIQHANGYVTSYSHMSTFGRGVEEGARVRQGQVIGTIGNTGLSTGPHLHYEVIVNGNFVNPMKIRLPRGRELDGRIMAEFRRQREAIEELVSRGSGARVVAQRDVRRN
ncbi:MAG: peptidoglycan DD-metalloendopeptidase family protein [Bosea sp. (in: a-proteobacteria)]